MLNICGDERPGSTELPKQGFHERCSQLTEASTAETAIPPVSFRYSRDGDSSRSSRAERDSHVLTPFALLSLSFVRLV